MLDNLDGQGRQDVEYAWLESGENYFLNLGRMEKKETQFMKWLQRPLFPGKLNMHKPIWVGDVVSMRENNSDELCLDSPHESPQLLFTGPSNFCLAN